MGLLTFSCSRRNRNTPVRTEIAILAHFRPFAACIQNTSAAISRCTMRQSLQMYAVAARLTWRDSVYMMTFMSKGLSFDDIRVSGVLFGGFLTDVIHL